MLTYILLNIPFAVFFLYAMGICRAKKEFAEQPATLAFYIFAGFLAHLVLSFLAALFLGKSGGSGINPEHVFQFFSVLHMLLYLSLLACVFAWRNTAEAAYKRPAILAGIAIGLEIIIVLVNMWVKHTLLDGGYQGNPQLLVTVAGVIKTALNFTAFIFVLTAIFDSRGYPPTGPSPFAAALGIPSGSTSSAPVTAASVAAAETSGIFEEQDFIPYVCGTMLLGGLVVVPLIWGGMMDLDYTQALLPSLLSCGIFALSHDKRGNFLWGRFILMILFMLFTMLKALAKAGPGGGKPMFMAGGVLGYLVMFACGWVGIAVARFVRGRLAQD